MKVDVDVPEMVRTADMSRNVRLENGDIVFARRAPQFFIYGEVQRAGAYRLEPEMTVQQALSVGGGLTPRGTVRGLKIDRKMADGNVQRIDAQLTDRVQPEDVVYINWSLF